jgi:hypothetical protein
MLQVTSYTLQKRKRPMILLLTLLIAMLGLYFEDCNIEELKRITKSKKA